jgi:ABC-type transporter MlaC component
VTKVETDLSQYVTEKAIAALFTQIAAEEKKIRTDPAARVSDILKKVFDPNAIVQ